MMKTCAIIAAGGSGKRFNSGIPKQFTCLLDRPIISYSIEAFRASGEIDCIIAAVPQDYLSSPIIEGLGLDIIVCGGQTRAQSVLNALEEVDKSFEFVIVHDAARPLVTTREIKNVISDAKKYGAACLVAPITDTVKEVSDDGFIVQSPDRARLKRALTPQAFRREILLEALSVAGTSESVTDESSALEIIGRKVKAVEGSSLNIKITTHEDFLLAEWILKTKAAGYSG
ncbi:MAG TPA: 2-C-methyl-D-erythritol 4-phosphate cytidylyltransferase [Pyrinomonadaceae bacterium]|nr:2-C-methyl-D-erythritol 4-phosphate cytidylyltransferase [Pyrinomonadaceae bacterium]